MVTTNGPRTWQLAQAKAHLSELVDGAEVALQTIERRGTPVAVVIGIDAYEQATEALATVSAEGKMARFLAASAAIGAEGGAVLDVGKRQRRSSPFGRRR